MKHEMELGLNVEEGVKQNSPRGKLSLIPGVVDQTSTHLGQG